MHIEMNTLAPWRRLGLRLGVIVLALVVLRLPIHDLFRYAMLMIAAVLVFTGTVTMSWRRWLAALLVAGLAAAGLAAWPAPRIDEGYNFFFSGPRAAADLKLPPDVAQLLGSQFAAEYPSAHRCNDTFPHPQGFAFSADALYDHPAFSRRVTGINFSDPVHLRLGDINKLNYNWVEGRCNVKRFKRDRHSLNLFDRYRLLFPTYLVYRLPADFVGSRLCWRGTVLWPRGEAHFDVIDHATTACRDLTAGDIGHRLYAVSIKRSERLAMSLHASAEAQLRRALEYGLMFAGVFAIVLSLVKVNAGRLRLPATIIALTLLVAVVIDINFIGGFRPLDDGDDGFTYEGYTRAMVHHVLNGDIVAALRGEESVYFFTPGLRYFRTLERFLFGDTYFGYLSVILMFPFIVLALFRRFLPQRWALVMLLAFVATPVGALFGSSLFYYASWAARGFADPLAFILLIAGLVLIIPKAAEVDNPRALTALFGAALLAAAIFCRPNLVLAGGMTFICAMVLALKQRRFDRVAALAGGFATLAVSPLHNYVFGRSTVPFSDNVYDPRTMLMPPLDYFRAVGEILRLDFTGPHIIRALQQLHRWLSGPTELLALVPLKVHTVFMDVVVLAGGASFLWRAWFS